MVSALDSELGDGESVELFAPYAGQAAEVLLGAIEAGSERAEVIAALFETDITDGITEHWSGWLLLVIYVASQMASTYFMSTTMQKSQRIIMMVLPLVFVILIINPPVGGTSNGFPTGLMIYWVTTNLWTVGQGLITRRFVPKPALPDKRSSRTPPKDGGGGGDGKRPAPKPKPAAPAKSQQQQQQPARPVKKKRQGRARR